MSLRRTWEGNRYRGKLTAGYELGRMSGNRTVRTTVYAAQSSQSAVFTHTRPGLTVHYFTLSGSLLDKEKQWKITPGCTCSFQTGQHSLSGSLKFEYRW